MQKRCHASPPLDPRGSGAARRKNRQRATPRAPQRRRPRQRLRPRLLRLNGDLVASTTTAAAQRRFGGYDHGNGYDHDCCGSTTVAITTLTMVTIAAAMATIAEPMGVLERPLSRAADGYGSRAWGVTTSTRWQTPLPPGDACHHPPQKDKLLTPNGGRPSKLISFTPARLPG